MNAGRVQFTHHLHLLLTHISQYWHPTFFFFGYTFGRIQRCPSTAILWSAGGIEKEQSNNFTLIPPCSTYLVQEKCGGSERSLPQTENFFQVRPSRLHVSQNSNDIDLCRENVAAHALMDLWQIPSLPPVEQTEPAIKNITVQVLENTAQILEKLTSIDNRFAAMEGKMQLMFDSEHKKIKATDGYDQFMMDLLSSSVITSATKLRDRFATISHGLPNYSFNPSVGVEFNPPTDDVTPRFLASSPIPGGLLPLTLTQPIQPTFAAAPSSFSDVLDPVPDPEENPVDFSKSPVSSEQDSTTFKVIDDLMAWLKPSWGLVFAKRCVVVYDWLARRFQWLKKRNLICWKKKKEKG